jgi:hypothetical protein
MAQSRLTTSLSVALVVELAVLAMQQTVGFPSLLSRVSDDVRPPPPLVLDGNSASCDTIAVPDAVKVGQVFDVTVGLKNIGETTWTDGTNTLAFWVDARSDYPTKVRLPMPSVAPSSLAQFSIPSAAPVIVGEYTIQAAMETSDGSTFGTPCTKTYVVTE